MRLTSLRQHGRSARPCWRASATRRAVAREAGCARPGGGRLVEQRVRCGSRAPSKSFPACCRSSSYGGAYCPPENRAPQGVLEPLLRLPSTTPRRGRRHGQRHRRFHHGQPATRRARARLMRGKSVPNLYEYKSKRLFGYEPLAPRTIAAARQRGYPARAEPVRELPLLVHVLHEAGFRRGAVRPVHEEDLRGRASSPCRPNR